MTGPAVSRIKLSAFDNDVRQAVLRNLAAMIRPGGLLLLDSSEVLRDRESLFKTETIGPTLWQRRI